MVTVHGARWLLPGTALMLAIAGQFSNLRCQEVSQPPALRLRSPCFPTEPCWLPATGNEDPNLLQNSRAVQCRSLAKVNIHGQMLAYRLTGR
jgi:hypothetical protein